MRVAELTIAVFLTIALLASAAEAEVWTDLRDEGDQLFGDGEFAQAADKYNASFNAALVAGRGAEALVALSRLGICFDEGRIQDPALLTRYANSSGLAYLRMAENQTLANATDYLLRAGYIFGFRGLEDYIGLARGEYLQLMAAALEDLILNASSSADHELWRAAGEAYYESGILALNVEDARASVLFGSARANLEKAADQAGAAGGAWNLSDTGSLYRRAGIAAGLSGSDPGQLFSSAAAAYVEAARLLLESGDTGGAKDRLVEAASLYEESGLSELASQTHREAADLASRLVTETSYGSHLQALEAAEQYDAAGDYLKSAEHYLLALGLFPSDLINQLPWLHAEALEILGRGRRGTRARLYADFLLDSGLDSVVFVAAPFFSGYDLINDIGPGVEDYQQVRFADRVAVTAKLIMAAGYVINHLPAEALSLLEELPRDALDLDPPNRALYELVASAADAQGGIAAGQGEFPGWRDLVTRVYLDDLLDVFSELQPSALYFTEPRRESMLRSLLTDLEREVTFSRPVEYYLTEAQDLVDEISGTRYRNASENKQIADLLSNVAWRWAYQGQLNQSWGLFQSASFHACAGEDFQRAVLYNDYTISNLGAMTYLSAASFRVAEAMIAGNDTMKAEARSYVTGNASMHLSTSEIAVLLSVLEGRTDLGGISPFIGTVGMAFIAGFVILTSYVILIWEPKHPLGKVRESRQPESETEAPEGLQSTEDTEMDSPRDDEPRKPGSDAGPERAGER